MAAGLALATLGGGFGVAEAYARPQVPPPVANRHRERHPEIRKAMRQLANARKTMNAARDDFHGHKAKALQLTDAAIAELKAALAADRR